MRRWSKFLRFGLFLLLFLTISFYLYRLRPITDDELYNYGYVHNIMSGLVPYLDFNMIVCPLFFYLVIPFFCLLGDKLIVYHFILSFLITFIFYEGFRKIGYQIIVVLGLILFYPYAGYNVFCLFLLFLMIFYQDREWMKKFRPLFIIMMFLTKQTLGLMMIPSFIETKRRKKLVLIYLVSILVLVLYLVSFNSFFSFVNYCFLGMFDFTSKNGTFISPLMVAEFMIMGLLFLFYLRSLDIHFLYLFFFQIIVFPIVDYLHFCIGIAPVVYYFLLYFKNKKFVSHHIFTFSFAVTLTLHFVLFSVIDYSLFSWYSVHNFMDGRLVANSTYSLIQAIDRKDFFEKRVFVLGNFSYLVKLNLDIPIDCYDNINQGNMGYRGEEVYIDNIRKTCQERDCIFLFNNSESYDKNKSQTSKKILNYIKNNYQSVYSSIEMNMYRNYKK